MAGIVIQALGKQDADSIEIKGVNPDSVWWRSVHPKEGIVLFGPEIIDGKFDLTKNLSVQSSSLEDHLIDIEKSEALFGKIKAVNDQINSELIDDDHFVRQFRKSGTTEIGNPYKKRFDYSTMQRFLGHALKYYAASRMLNYMEESEKARAEAIQKWQEQYDVYMSSGEEEMHAAWTSEYHGQFATTGSTVQSTFKQGCQFPWRPECWEQKVVPNGMYGHALNNPWDYTNDPESLTSLQNLFSKTLWQNEPMVISQLGEFDPNSNFRMIAWGDGLDNYSKWLNSKANGFVGVDGIKNWVSLNPANNFWDISNFRNPLLNPGGMPKNLSFKTQKKFLKGYLLFGACLAGIAVLARIFSAISNNKNASYNKNGFESSQCYASHTSRLLANSVGDSLAATWIKNLIKSHDPTQFALDAYSASRRKIDSLLSGLGKILGSEDSDVTGENLSNSFKVIDASLNNSETLSSDSVAGTRFLVIDENKLEAIKEKYPTTNSVFNYAALSRDLNTQLYSSAKEDALVRPEFNANGSFSGFKIINGGSGYKKGVGIAIYKATSTGTGTQFEKVGTVTLVDENSFITNKFYKICYGTLFENLKELRSNLKNFSNVVKSKDLEPLFVNEFVGSPNDRWNWVTPFSIRKLYLGSIGIKNKYLITYVNNDGGIVTEDDLTLNSNATPFQVFRVKIHEGSVAQNRRGVGEYYNQVDNNFTPPFVGVEKANRIKEINSDASKISEDEEGLYRDVKMKIKGQSETITLRFYFVGNYYVQRNTGNASSSISKEDRKRLCAFYDTLAERLDRVIYKGNQTLTKNYAIVKSGPDTEIKKKGSVLIPILEARMDSGTGKLLEVYVKEKGWHYGEDKVKSISVGSGGCERVDAQGNTINSKEGERGTASATDLKISGVNGNLTYFKHRFKSPSGVLFNCVLVPIYVEKTINDENVKYLDKVHVREEVNGSFEKITSSSGSDVDKWTHFTVETSVTIIPKASEGTDWAATENIRELEAALSDEEKRRLAKIEMASFTAENAIEWKVMFQKHWDELESFASIISKNQMSVKGGNNEFKAAPLESRAAIYKQLQRMRLTSSPNDAGGGSTITSDELEKLRNFTFYAPTFGKCENATFNGISEALSKTFFKDQTAYNMFITPGKINERLCNKKACGAVHAYTRVPPIGISEGVNESIDGKKTDPLPICGNATITFRFFPTMNTQVRDNLGKTGIAQIFGADDLHLNRNTIPNVHVTSSGLIQLLSLPSVGYLSSIFKSQKSYTPSTGDIGLPEIWGNWSNASFNVKGKDGDDAWTGGLVEGLLAKDNLVSSIFSSLIGLFTDKHLPNLAIWHLKSPKDTSKDVGARAWVEGKGGKYQQTLEYVNKLRSAYEKNRMMKYGWGPYAHEYAVGGIRGKRGLGQSGEEGGDPYTDGYSFADMGTYHMAHIGKVLQGFYRDLNLTHKTWSANGVTDAGQHNIHPSSKNSITATSEANFHDNVQINLPKITKGFGAGDFNESSFEESNSPLSITRTLSGLCYPVVKQHDYEWRRLILMADSDEVYKGKTNPFDDFEHWGQQREEAALRGEKNHSAFLSTSLVPLSWQQIIMHYDQQQSIINDFNDYAASRGWTQNSDGSTRTLESIKKEILIAAGGDNPQTTDLESAWGVGVNDLKSKFPIREYQEITSHTPMEAEKYDEINIFDKSQGTQGAGHNVFGIPQSSFAPGTIVDNIKSAISSIADTKPNKKLDFVRPKSDETFPGNNEWAGLVEDVEEKMKNMAYIFPRIYIHDYKYGTEVTASGIPINANAEGEAANQDTINLQDFIKSYVSEDRVDNDGKPEWERGGYWSAWDAAYQKTVKGKWGLEGVGPNLRAAKADLSGQAMVYSELINKFHYLDNIDNGIEEIENIDAAPINGWGDINNQGDITKTEGWGHTAQEAQNNALTALKHELRTLLHSRSVANPCNFNPTFSISQQATWKFQTNDPLDSFIVSWKETETQENITLTNAVGTDDCQEAIGLATDCASTPRKYHIFNSAIGNNNSFNNSEVTPLYAKYHAGDVPDNLSVGTEYMVDNGCLNPKVAGWRPPHKLYGYSCSDSNSQADKDSAKDDAIRNLGYIYERVLNHQSFDGVSSAGESPAGYNSDEKCLCEYNNQDAYESDGAFNPITNLWATQNQNPLLVKHLSFSDYLADTTTLGYQTITNNPNDYQVEIPNGSNITEYKIITKGATEEEAENRARGLFAMFTGTDNPAYKEYFGSVSGLINTSNDTSCACTPNVTVSSDYLNISFVPFNHNEFSSLSTNIKSSVDQGLTDNNGNPVYGKWGPGVQGCIDSNTSNTNNYTGEFDANDADSTRAQWGEWANTGIINIPVGNVNAQDTTVQDLYECIQDAAFDRYMGMAGGYVNVSDGLSGNALDTVNYGIVNYSTCQTDLDAAYQCQGQVPDPDGNCYPDAFSMLTGTNPLYYSTANGGVMVDSNTCGVNVSTYQSSALPFGSLANAANAQDSSYSDCGCEIADLCDTTTAAANYNLPQGYKCYGRTVSKIYNGVSISLYEQIISGRATNPDGDVRAGILSQTYWGTLEHKNYYNDNKYTAEMTLNNCETYIAELTGACPILDYEGIYKSTITGTLHCGTANHKYKLGLHKNKYKGFFYASGMTPWVTGVADWTNGGITIYKHDETKQVLPRYHEQEYIVNYGDDANFAEVSYEKKHIPSTTRHEAPNVKTNKHVLTSTTPSPAASSQGSRRGEDVAWALDMNLHKQNWAKVKYHPRTWEDNDPECEKFDDQGNCIKVKLNLESKPAENGGVGDNFFMGGWKLVNPAWPHKMDTSKVEEKVNEVLGENIVILDRNPTDPNLKDKKKAAPNKDKRAYSIVANGKSWGGNNGNILAVFHNEESFSDYIDKVSTIRNTEVLDYGSVSSGEGKAKINRHKIDPKKFPNKEINIDIVYAVIRGALSACEHCLPTHIDNPEDQSQEKQMYFGEQFLLGQKVKWDIYKGDYRFAVPLTLEAATVPNPLMPDKNVKLHKWEEKVTPKEAKFDDRLSRTHYLLSEAAYDSSSPPAIGCGNYSKFDKIIEYTTWTNRAWAEIPMGGMIERFAATNPVYVGIPGNNTAHVGGNSTSTTSLEITSSGDITLTVGTGLSYKAGDVLLIASGNNSMEGDVVSYDSQTGALVVTVKSSNGTGTHSNWAIRNAVHRYNEVFDGNVAYNKFMSKDDYKTNLGKGIEELDLTKGGAQSGGINNTWKE